MAYKPWSDKENNLLLKLAEDSIPYKRRVEYFEERSQDSIRQQTWMLKQQVANKWVEDERVAFFDIETSHLKANIGIMLNWSVKYLSGELKHDCITRKEAIDPDRQDKRIVQTLIRELENADLVVTYYGTGFDLPFIRTRAEILGLDFPGYAHLKHFDMYYLVRAKLQLHSNRLAVATETLGIEGKTALPPAIWQKARLGDKDALAYAAEHCDEDVLILERLYERLKKYSRMTRKSI